MQRSLNELTNILSMIDDDLAPEEFEVEEIVGEIRDKVDAIKWRIDSWLAHADAIQKEWIDPLTTRKRALEGKAQRLKDYCAWVMAKDQLTALPGHAFSLQLRQSTAVETEVSPGPKEAMEMPVYCKSRVTYQWDKSAIAEALKAGKELPFAKLKVNKHVLFTTKKELTNEPTTTNKD